MESEETDFLLDSLHSIPGEALQEIMRILEKGSKKQDDLLRGLLKKNPNFGRELKQFIEKNMQKMAVTASDTEHDQAESILDQL